MDRRDLPFRLFGGGSLALRIGNAFRARSRREHPRHVVVLADPSSIAGRDEALAVARRAHEASAPACR